MPDLIFQRLDRAGYWEKYPIYLNRKQVDRIAFAQEKVLRLEAGRYHIAIGGLGAKDAELWIDLGEHRRVIQIDAELLGKAKKVWPKWYQIKLRESTPLAKAKPAELGQLKYLYGQALIRAFAFMALLLLAAAYLMYLGKLEDNLLLASFAIFPALLAPWAYRGVLKAQLRN